MQNCMPNGPWVKHSGMDPGSMASASLRPSLGQRGWNHGPYCRVEVHGPSGLGDLCAVQVIFRFAFVWMKGRFAFIINKGET